MALNDTLRRWGRLSPHRTVLSLLVLGTLGAMAAAAAQKADIANLKPQDIDVAVQPVAFEAADPSRRDFGRLSFRGGLVLSAANPAFGGYSGLSLNADGTEFLAVSDGGSWFSAKLVAKNGRLAGLKEARIGPLTQKGGRCGAIAASKPERCSRAESMPGRWCCFRSASSARPGNIPARW
jgi:hypothetical protein